MRWKGFIFIGVVVGIVFLLGLVFTDQWVENRLEDIGSAAVGAKVDIDDLDIAHALVKAAQDTVGGIEKPNSGLLFIAPLLEIYGLNSENRQ